MSMTKPRPPVKPTRPAPRPERPFGEGIFPDDSRLGDEERRALDELRGDFQLPPDDLPDALLWPEWVDEWSYAPGPEDAEWWASESARLTAARIALARLRRSPLAPTDITDYDHLVVHGCV